MNDYRQRWNSPLGELLLQANEHALTGVWFFDQKYAPESFSATKNRQSSIVLSETIKWLTAYFNAEVPDVSDLTFEPSGTDFQQTVWKALLTVPSGQTITYGGLANQLGKAKAVRAVAAAVGRNPISLLIPCHRVVGANGSLTGYAGGLDRKRSLLTLENARVESRATSAQLDFSE